MRIKQTLYVLVVCLCGLAATTAVAENKYSELVVFGDSLSDPGNVYELTGTSSKRPFAAGNIPSAPYAIGGHHFSNGKTWSEKLSKSLKSKGGKKPALKSPKYTNYAFGGSRANPSAGGPFDLSAQLGSYLANTGGTVDSDALYAVFFGGNDIRDALVAFNIAFTQTLSTSGDPAAALAAGQIAAGSILTEAVTAIADNIIILGSLGVQHLLVPNAPNLGLVPAVTGQGPAVAGLATQLSHGFNQALENALAAIEFAIPTVHITRFDTFSFMTARIADPGSSGFKNVVDACITPEVKKGAICKKPKEYFFWDGIHPTKVVHKLIAEAVLAELP